jgi:hypothetical protein
LDRASVLVEPKSTICDSAIYQEGKWHIIKLWIQDLFHWWCCVVVWCGVVWWCGGVLSWYKAIKYKNDLEKIVNRIDVEFMTKYIHFQHASTSLSLTHLIPDNILFTALYH